MTRESDPQLRIEPLTSNHDRQSFQCGVAELDDFLRRYAQQAQKKDLSRTFVLVGKGSSEILGYYTLSLRQISIELIPPALLKRLPRYPVPVVHIARLAVAQIAQRHGYGSLLLMDALKQAARISEIAGVHAVDVEASDDALAAWYKSRFGFIELLDAQRHLLLPMREIRAWLSPKLGGG